MGSTGTSTGAYCWSCGGIYGNCWCVAEMMQTYKAAAEAAQRATPVYAASLRHYAGR